MNETEINEAIMALEYTGRISDGYHTFDELYEHRIALWLIVCQNYEPHRQNVWRSRLHHDGSSYTGWFILGMFTKPGQQITYHLPDEKWDDCCFALTLDRAPKWDGHTSQDVLERIANL